MSRGFLAVAGVLILGTGGACLRKQVIVVEPVPEPITAMAVEPPKPAPVVLGEPPRVKEEAR